MIKAFIYGVREQKFIDHRRISVLFKEVLLVD